MDLTDNARKFIEGLVASLNEGRYSLAIPVERSESCVQHGLKVLQLPRKQARLHLREAADQGVVVLEH